MQRDDALQRFTDAALAAYRAHTPRPEASAWLDRIAAALQTSPPRRAHPGKRLPVCAHLDAALAVETGNRSLGALIDTFRAVEPDLEWQHRASYDETASANLPDRHANAMILGPAGLENRADVWLGVSLMAPSVRYTDHAHAPEETYLVLSEGEFLQGDAHWFTPGIGGSFYNPPRIKHAMLSGPKPLFAYWALWPDPKA
jgi:hypothetical protein